MAHSAQARKRIRQAEERRLHNKSRKSEIKTLAKSLEGHVERGEAEAARSVLPKLISRLDKAAKTNLYHQNNVARQKSKAATLVSGLESGGPDTGSSEE